MPDLSQPPNSIRLVLRYISRNLGMSATYSHEWHEYRVNLPNGTEATAYYTEDASDAIATARAMALQRAGQEALRLELEYRASKGKPCT